MVRSNSDHHIMITLKCIGMDNNLEMGYYRNNQNLFDQVP